VYTELPIIQAPMAGVQSSALAVAVSNAGGLGSLPCALLTADQIRAEIATIKAQTDKPFSVNFFCHIPPTEDETRERAWRDALAPFYRELDVADSAIVRGAGRHPFDHDVAEIVDELRPPVVSFHFGLPAAELLDRVRASGATILSSATTVGEARWLEQRGVNAIIAQGNEAGGHRGMFLTDDVTTQIGTFALLPQIVKAVRVPVIAAGGIADARGVAAAMALGATAVQVGTAYLLCRETTTSTVHRAALVSDAARHTALTNLFTGRPARAIVNRLMRELGPLNPLAPAFPLAASAIMPLRAKAEQLGSGDFSPLWSGQNPAGAQPIGAGELTRQLAR
jgi:nitronate monooxygenase